MPAKNIINPQDKQVLSDLLNIANYLDIPIILVGAGARILIFDRQFGDGRGTTDWDVGISIDSWQSYTRLHETLTQGNAPRFRATSTLHKIVHIETNIEVDIIPFGDIAQPDGKIIWSDSENSMNVLGFTEARVNSEITRIENLEIPILTLPAFVTLKIFAWGDRGERTQKDLEDIEFIFAKYEDDERVYNELYDELANETLDFLDANIYLLGRDISRLLQSTTLTELKLVLDRLLESLQNRDSLSLYERVTILKRGILSVS
ncbi:hypothetical protein [Baaleninema simplex]|uniref:hypothetical protein n=1 Tax=Baaleninema simplex TaxID=2862350 RepID=UPI000346E3CF|nr:hypothetical protein [Baaleninema simplex]